MQRKIEHLLSLYQSADSIKKELDSLVMEVAERYIRAASEGNGAYPSSAKDIICWSVEGDDIECEWSEYWSYGGHDEGSFSFPAKFLYDEDALMEYEKKRIKQKKQYEQDKKDAQIKCDQAELERLKVKLGK